ncbi:MAG: AMP-binding protein [Gammaproteobacteria bacterium]|nr:AMP-binding protein [Gammaproteobacteria bacterium]
MNKRLPILLSSRPETPIFWYKNEIITHAQFQRDVSRVAALLPLHPYLINLCEDRYLFALGFVASIIQQQICLMPAHRAEKEIERLAIQYPDSHRIDDAIIESFLNEKNSGTIAFPQEIDTEQLVAIIFTSGSTGEPKANYKKWGTLVDSAGRVAEQLRLNQPAQHTLVATVPPQHMYGFETTIIFPLVTGVCVHNSKPFFPDDIRHVLNEVSSPSILVTTPIHLRACVQTELHWPEIDFALSATAPLTEQLAQQVEQSLHTRVREIYGCSEAGVIATRETNKNSIWQLLPGYEFKECLDGFCLITPQLQEEIFLPDQIQLLDDQHFNLLGRQSDLIKIAGKRGSLNDLKIKLCALNGIEDAVFFMANENPDENSRIAAFVVAPDLEIKEINAFFSQQVDNAFMPRPLIKVDKLPYNETGKLPLKSILELYKQYRTNKYLKDSA